MGFKYRRSGRGSCRGLISTPESNNVILPMGPSMVFNANARSTSEGATEAPASIFIGLIRSVVKYHCDVVEAGVVRDYGGI